MLDKPLRWRKPRRVFVNSMSDLFHEEIPDEYIARVFDVMAEAPQHVFQVLTKRPERMRDLSLAYAATDHQHNDPPMWPLPNVWLVVSIENRRFVGRADLLRETPAAVRFISAEPLLGPLIEDDYEMDWADGYEGPGLVLKDIDWVIVGGESGPGHRRMDPAWVRMLRDCCLLSCGRCERIEGECICEEPAFEHSRRRAFFFKQWGGPKPTSGGRELDARTWDEMPEADRG